MNWITDKQPTKIGRYLTTVEINDSPMVMELFWDGKNWKDNRRAEAMGFIGMPYKTQLYPKEITKVWWADKVIAWGILPFPYDKEVEL